MIIAIDMVATSLGSGTKTYNLNFCEYLNKLKINDKIFIFITKDYLRNINLNHNPNIKYIVKSSLLNNILLRMIWMQLILPIELKILKVNQLFSPMNMGPICLKFFNIKFILALHSNLPWVYFSKMPGNIVRNYLTKILMEFSVSACDKLIVDSDFAKNEIIKLLNVDKEKVFSIYLGIDKKYLTESKNVSLIEDFDYKDYILTVLSCVKYHNILKLLKSFKLLKKEHNIKLRFVLVLQVLDQEYFKIIKNFTKNNFESDEIIFFHNLDNKYLINLYREANFFIFSSYCEVFGLTSLEAMSQGCPVLISNCSALSEINSDAAEYFDPDKEHEIKDSMLKILNNTKYREENIKKANKHFKKFSWDKTVKETIKVFN
tara:strand:- start:962 stop:2086 length:1125 start_codon:yes stop_codon:yes gene_type:complete